MYGELDEEGWVREIVVEDVLQLPRRTVSSRVIFVCMFFIV